MLQGLSCFRKSQLVNSAPTPCSHARLMIFDRLGREMTVVAIVISQTIQNSKATNAPWRACKQTVLETNKHQKLTGEVCIQFISSLSYRYQSSYGENDDTERSLNQRYT